MRPSKRFANLEIDKRPQGVDNVAMPVVAFHAANVISLDETMSIATDGHDVTRGKE